MSLLSLMSWNMNQQPSNWETVLESAVDVALLQEAKPPPSLLRDKIDADYEGIWGKSEIAWGAVVAGLSSRIDFEPIKTKAVGDNNPEALSVSYPGTLSAAFVRILEAGEEFIIASLYAKWERPIQQTQPNWIYADASVHRLISDLSALIARQNNHKIIVAGDLNILYGYGEYGIDYWKKRYDTVFDRMSSLGLRFIGPQAPDGGEQASPWPDELPQDSHNVPTYRTNRGSKERQLDFVFASESIADRLSVRAANNIEEWGPSDHCRIFIDLKY